MGRWAREWRGGSDRLAARLESIGLKAASALARRRLGVDDPGRAAEAPRWAAEVLRCASARICDYSNCEDWDPPAPETTSALKASAAMIRAMPGPTRERLWGALALFEAGPVLLGPRRARFTELDPGEQRAYIASWCEAKIAARRAIFEAIKSVCMLGYWSQPACWPSIHYDLRTEGGFTGGVEAPGVREARGAEIER